MMITSFAQFLSNRWLLILALSATFALGEIVTPWGRLASIAPAHADDDGGGGGNAGGGRSGGGERYTPRATGSQPNLFKLLKRQFRQDRPVRKRRNVSAAASGHVPGQIVALGLTEAQRNALIGRGFVLRSYHALANLGGEVVKLDPPRGRGLETARADIRALAPAASVDFNHLYRPQQEVACGGRPCVAPALVGWPTSPLGTCQAADVTVGLIDTAINPDHESFASSRLEVLRLDPSARDGSSQQHGTAVASLLVGTGGSGTPGLLPNGRLIGVDAFRANDRAEVYDLARAIDILAGRNVSVINMSLSGPDNAVLAKAIQLAAGKKIGLVAAAGNDGPGAKAAFPAAYDEVIAVTAVDRQKKPYRRANRGDYIDLAAPGVGVWAAASVAGARPKTGTSFAAPFVTAAVALAKSRAPEADVQKLLTSQAEDLGETGKDDVFGHGLLNVRSICEG